MKASRIINNLTRIGIGLGLLFPIGSLIIDLWIKQLDFSFKNLASLYALKLKGLSKWPASGGLSRTNYSLWIRFAKARPRYLNM